MNTPQRHQLIDGDFTPEQATQVLLSLVKNKIDFHNVEKLSNHERFGKDVTQSGRRLEALRQLHETLQSECRSLLESGQHVRINGWIEIQPVDKRSATKPPARAAVSASA